MPRSRQHAHAKLQSVNASVGMFVLPESMAPLSGCRGDLLSLVQILLTDLAERFEGRLGFVGGIEYSAVRVVMRSGIGELIPKYDLYGVLCQ